MPDCDVIVLIDYKGVWGTKRPPPPGSLGLGGAEPPQFGNDCWDYIFCLMDQMRLG